MVEQTEQRVDLAAGAGRLDRERLGIDIDDAHAEQSDDLKHIGAVRLVRGDLDEHEFALDGGRFVEVDDFQHMQQFVELLDDLLERHLLDVGGHRDAGDVGALGG